MRIVGIMLLLSLILQGCGRKGPLLLPAAPMAVPPAATASQPAAASQPSAAQPEDTKK